jgi:hypothetical protein
MKTKNEKRKPNYYYTMSFLLISSISELITVYFQKYTYGNI